VKQRYISVKGWRAFQHYDPAKRTPPWIKQYTELLHDDAYMALPVGTALVLHRLWLEYASSRCRLAVETASLTRRLGVRVTMPQLKSLKSAGFIDFVASAKLADGYHTATPEVEVRSREEKDSPLPPHRNNHNHNHNSNGKGNLEHAKQLVRNGGYELTDDSLRDEFKQRKVNESDQAELFQLARELRAAA
jgi:hypothetical protein